MTSLLLARIWSALDNWYIRRRTRAALEAIDDRLLRDIGIDRCEIDSVVTDMIQTPQKHQNSDTETILGAHSFHY